MTSKEIDKKVVLSWLQGDYSLAQLRTLQEYLRDPAYRESLEKFLQEEWTALDVARQPSLPDLEQQYEKFRSQLPVREPEQSPVRRLPARRWMPIAAAAAVIFFLVGMIWFLYHSSGPAGKDNNAISWVVLNTAPGEKRTIQLPDSSLVYLGVASTLRYNAGYNSKNRSVFLEGEGYFDVRHGGHYPFTVNTGDLATIDIGTEFNIRHYAGQGNVEVTVAKGRVEVHNKQGGNESRIAALGEGQQLQYDSAAARAVTVSLSETSLVGSWRKGILVFRKQSLKEVTDELERYYGVSIRYSNPAHTTILLTTLLDNRNLEEALDIV
ncbi:MAG TPA: FecR domain-containing protein, partial [Puia sp.]|nr:FecR domain-containing protein [Puia sp.]